MSACPLTSCTWAVASFITWTSMCSSDEVGGGGGGVTQLPCSSFTIPTGIECCTPSMFGHTSSDGGGVTQLPCSSFTIPTGIECCTPSMFGHTSSDGGG